MQTDWVPGSWVIWLGRNRLQMRESSLQAHNTGSNKEPKNTSTAQHSQTDHGQKDISHFQQGKSERKHNSWKPHTYPQLEMYLSCILSLQDQCTLGTSVRSRFPAGTVPVSVTLHHKASTTIGLELNSRQFTLGTGQVDPTTAMHLER